VTYFILSIVALLCGPFIYGWARGRPTGRQLLDGFILVTVAGIVCVYIIPDAVVTGGRLAWLFLFVGLLFPVAIEKVFRESEHQAHIFIVILAASGLVIHALIDGLALLPGVGSAISGADDGTNSRLWNSIFSNQLAIGVILHRLPVGMAIWWSVRPGFGTGAAIATFATVIAATAAAFFFGAPTVALAELQSLAYFQSFVAGSLVHIVAFGVNHEHNEVEATGRRFVAWGFRAGVLLGMFMLFALPHLH
jgi:zinc transporter ZupT